MGLAVGWASALCALLLYVARRQQRLTEGWHGVVGPEAVDEDDESP